MNSQSFKAFNPDSEVRAFLFQQIQELSDFATGLGAVVVMLEEGEGESPFFVVNMIVSPDDLGLKVRVEGPDIYEALATAKAEAKYRLAAIYAAMESAPQPKVEIQSPGRLAQIH